MLQPDFMKQEVARCIPVSAEIVNRSKTMTPCHPQHDIKVVSGTLNKLEGSKSETTRSCLSFFHNHAYYLYYAVLSPRLQAVRNAIKNTEVQTSANDSS